MCDASETARLPPKRDLSLARWGTVPGEKLRIRVGARFRNFGHVLGGKWD